MNRLGSEKSPYLRQHAHNPVHWWPWGAEAFNEAKRRDLPIFLSIGYATCHWCHVMEKESFENTKIAEVLNQRFVSIKVDREELPDVDAIYMEAVQALQGHGGWPLSVFLDAEAKPFFGATYLPPDRFRSALIQISDAWNSQRQRCNAASSQLFNFLKREEASSFNELPPQDIFLKFYRHSAAAFDAENGGHLGAPKFPPNYELRMLLRMGKDVESDEIVTKSVDALVRGGIYDHLGGGIARYATDEKWLVPHFEKMLYDQAAFCLTLAESFQVFQDKEYELALRETLDYVIRDLSHSEGAYFSAEDADSEGVEGKFYVWSFHELVKLLEASEIMALQKHYGISPEGNFEGQNILALQPGHTRVNESPEIKELKKTLLEFRSKRPRPLRDEKILCSWNGLMIAAMARSARVLGEEKYLNSACRAADFVLKHMKSSEGDFYRRWIDGEAKYLGHLDDFAFMIFALLELFESSQNEKYLEEAHKLQSRQDELFFDAHKKNYFLTREGETLLLRRTKDLTDNVLPSGNAIACLNLLKFGLLDDDFKAHARATDLLKSLPENASDHPLAFCQWLMSYDFYIKEPQKLLIANESGTFKDLAKVHKQIASTFLPQLVIRQSSSQPRINNKDTFYLCSLGSCQKPTTDLQKILNRKKEAHERT